MRDRLQYSLTRNNVAGTEINTGYERVATPRDHHLRTSKDAAPMGNDEVYVKYSQEMADKDSNGNSANDGLATFAKTQCSAGTARRGFGAFRHTIGDPDAMVP